MKLMDGWIVDALDAADSAIARHDAAALRDALSILPLELFTLLYFDNARRWPALAAWLPQLPPEADQAQWTGASGWQTMHQAAAFLDDMFARYAGDLRNARVLDYGCGWGRMLRLLYARVRVDNIYGVDPWPPALERLRGVHGNVAQVAYAPTDLPFDVRFDIIYAYSVFTHIGPTSQAAVLATLRKHIADDGLIAVTVRPADFWEGPETWPDAAVKAALLDQHLSVGFAFIENPPMEGGHRDYGRCSVSLDYIKREWHEWRVASVQWRAADKSQFVVYLRPA